MDDWPTPDEIAERCQEIQSRWTPEVRASRWAAAHGYDAVPFVPCWRPPMVTTEELGLNPAMDD